MDNVLCKFCNSENVYFSKKKNKYICEDCEQSFVIEKEIRPQKIFLSYGHDENAEIVELIYKKLQERGHDPWIDKAKIKAGHDWRNEITKGINESSDFLAFISSFSVRVPGVCLDEISIGVGNWNCRMQSVLLEKNVNVPNSISNIQWIDLSDWRQIKENSDPLVWAKWLDEKVQLIYDLVEDEHSAIVAGNISTLEQRLSPITCALKMRMILRNEIVGRKWIFRLISDWFNKIGTKKVLVLYGTPGFGKSVVSAYLCNFSSSCAVTFFFEWNNSDTRNLRKFVYSMMFQLACNIEDYQVALMDFLQKNNEKDLTEKELIDRCIIGLLNQLIDGGRTQKIIVLDAIDEAFADNGAFVDALIYMIDKLPDWIRVVVSARPEVPIQSKLKRYDKISLDDFASEINADIQEFVCRIVSDEFVAQRIIEKSNGSFIYAKELIEIYRNNDGVSFDVNAIPVGLGGVYFLNFERLFTNDDDYIQSYRPIFDVLLEVREQIDKDELSSILNIDEDALSSRLKRVNSYIFEIKNDGCVFLEIFHKSFQEWLTTEEAGCYRVNQKNGNKLLVDYILASVKSDAVVSKYVMKYAMDHLGVAGFENLSNADQEVFCSKLIAAAQRYGDLGMELRYLDLIKETFGTCHYYYINALEYYKKVSGEKLLEIAKEALAIVEQIQDEIKRFEFICQIAFSYFYAGYSQKSFTLILEEHGKHSEEFWENSMNAAQYMHVIAVCAHDLDKNEDVVRAAKIDVEMYRNDKRFYDSYISMVNLIDGLMAVGRLSEADQQAEKLTEYLDNRYYVHVDDIYQICYANLLQTEGRVMEALTYYESGLGLAKKIQVWDYIYGSIWRELAVARFGDSSCLSALIKFRDQASRAGYQYLKSLACCFYIVASHNLKTVNLQTYKDCYVEVLTIGMPGHMMQAVICASLDGVEKIFPEALGGLLNLCDGVKGAPEVVKELLLSEKENLDAPLVAALEKWIEVYVDPIESYRESFRSKNEECFEIAPIYAQGSCMTCQAKCCYDGAYLQKGEEEAIEQFVTQYPEHFTSIERPFIVQGDWPGMESQRKTQRKSFEGYDASFPKHFTKTRCVFAMESGECRLQRVTTDLQMHPWKVKPRACWLFPIQKIKDNKIYPPSVMGNEDPDYVDESYPGYSTFLPCTKTDPANGEVWFRKLKHEVEYYKYLVRIGKA